MATILILRETPTAEQLIELLRPHGWFIKLAVDVRREIVAAGGDMHADCEQVLLEDGSRQEDLWGADWVPTDHSVRFESLINIRPWQDNRSYEVQSPDRRALIEKVARSIFEES